MNAIPSAVAQPNTALMINDVLTEPACSDVWWS
jgi:hypothetical protein